MTLPQELLDRPDPESKRVDFIAFGILCVALISVSFAPIFVRLGETELGANATVTNRLLIFSLVFGCGRLIRQTFSRSQPESTRKSPFTLQEWLLLGSIGAVSVTTLGLWAIALEYTSVAKCMLLNNLTPIFTSLGSWLFLRKRFDNKFILGMVIALAGAIALGAEDLHGGETSLLGDFYALLSAVFLGAYFLIVERLRYSFSSTAILLWRGILGSILLLPIVIFTEGQLFPTTLVAWVGVIGLGIVSEGFGQRLLAESMSKFSSSFVALFLLLEPIVSTVLAWFIFAETITPITWVGFAVVLSGIYLAQSSGAATQDAVPNPRLTTSKL